MSVAKQGSVANAAGGDGGTYNAKRLLVAGFMAILAAGVGMSIRGAIFGDWAAAFNFTNLQTGLIGGAGFTGFCFGIIIGGVIVDRIGYGKLVLAAFLFHVLSALVTFCASKGMSNETAFVYLWVGTFLFAIANGTLEGVANPLVATLFPKNRTHYLNILHASWPAGLVLGSLIVEGFQFASGKGWVHLGDNAWKYQLGCFLIPSVLYGLLFLGQSFPKSEASAKGLSLGEMLKDVGVLGAAVVGLFAFLFFKDGLGPLLSGFSGSAFFGFTNEVAGASNAWMAISAVLGSVILLMFAGSSRWAIGAPLLLVLFLTHALVGAVELGTDGWIQNIEDTILSKGDGTFLFMFTSAVMFGMRFCGHFIEHKLGLKPVAILLVSAILGCIGLNLVSHVNSFGVALVALTIYAIGKSYFWPTMLAVTSDRFPKCGAVAISIMGGIGMMSAGLIGSPGLGYFKDRFSGEHLAKTPAIYAENKAEKSSSWLFFPAAHGIDAQKLDAAMKTDPKDRTDSDKALIEANVEGSRETLRVDSFIPATMAVIYLLLLIYFRMTGGYKAVYIGELGGFNTPMEA